MCFRLMAICDEVSISRKHLKIESIRGRLFVADLSSRNGTFYDGKYVIPGREVEVKEGVPLAIGMTVICFGEGCKRQIVPFLDTAGLILEKGKEEDVSADSGDRRSETEQEREDLLAKVARTLKGSEPLRVILEKVIGHFVHLTHRYKDDCSGKACRTTSLDPPVAVVYSPLTVPYV
jgi:pSer/pThr/pTyr-binding forkhead associated (FHA) protein